ncbi:MAG: AMP-binding protein [Flavobacteriaceae bacterium]|nr:AMP-binding protein [Flavobacteriaceae bacterium]
MHQRIDPLWHSDFKLNGLSFSTVSELLDFAQDLIDQGEAHEILMAQFFIKWFDQTPDVLVKTSGSTGQPKVMTLAKERMIFSARTTGAYFQTGAGTRALLCLPVHYIAGQMMLVRALILGWDLHVVAPSRDALKEYDNRYDFVALVPYQVHFALSALKRVKKIIIGGGVLSQELELTLQNYQVEAYATYGMTETITHVAARRINGSKRSQTYHAMPEIHFEQDDRDCLVIHAPGLSTGPIITNDVVRLESATAFTYLGRADFIINSGGIKHQPEVIEQKLLKHLKGPLVVASEPHPTLGEQLILILESDSYGQPAEVEAALASLTPLERPKKFYTLRQLPLTETGKVKRAQINEVLKTQRK